MNHYKWIIWKLACYERCYPTKCAGKFLTISNVLEELKYRYPSCCIILCFTIGFGEIGEKHVKCVCRYEREVNHGHRSAIKRILEGDASPSTMLVLCISAVCSNCEPQIEDSTTDLDQAETNGATKVELTDGWYGNANIHSYILRPPLKISSI